MPTIHVIDLAKLVKRIVIDAPKVHPYIFAIDRTKRPTQKRLIQAISKGIGTSEIANHPLTFKIPAYDFLTINLKMRTSDAFKDGQLTPEEEENTEDPEALLLTKKFPWHTEKGIIGNIRTLNNEFNEFRGLNPVKIFVSGPPASGKTFYSKSLAEYYNIPRVHVKQLTDEAFRIAGMEDEDIGEDEDKANLKGKITELRENMKAEMEEARGDPPEDMEDGWPEIDETTLPVRVPDDFLYKLLKLKLNENDCRNRGYILDGYPRTYKDSQFTFLKKVIKYDEEGEEVAEESEELEEGEEKTFDNYIKNDDIFPGSTIVLTGSNDDLIKRVKELPEESISGTHYNQADMERRLAAYCKAN